jgi:hypothetical protein
MRTEDYEPSAVVHDSLTLINSEQEFLEINDVVHTGSSEDSVHFHEKGACERHKTAA